LQYCLAGYIAIVAENPGIGQLDEQPVDRPDLINAGREKLSAELITLGRNYVGLSVYQKLHILDWLCEQPWVDTDRIVVSGHSLGTEPAMMMAVLDTRISALVFNDFLTDNRVLYSVAGKPTVRWGHISPMWHVIPGFLSQLDFPDVLAALAPNTKLIITEGGPQALLHKVATAFELAAASENFRYCHYPMFAEPLQRTSDGVWPPPTGLTDSEWLTFANVDVPKHCFHADIVLPWLSRVL
jgi:hypothetical protein